MQGSSSPSRSHLLRLGCNRYEGRRGEWMRYMLLPADGEGLPHHALERANGRKTAVIVPRASSTINT